MAFAPAPLTAATAPSEDDQETSPSVAPALGATVRLPTWPTSSSSAAALSISALSAVSPSPSAPVRGVTSAPVGVSSSAPVGALASAPSPPAVSVTTIGVAPASVSPVASASANPVVPVASMATVNNADSHRIPRFICLFLSSYLHKMTSAWSVLLYVFFTCVSSRSNFCNIQHSPVHSDLRALADYAILCWTNLPGGKFHGDAGCGGEALGGAGHRAGARRKDRQGWLPDGQRLCGHLGAGPSGEPEGAGRAGSEVQKVAHGGPADSARSHPHQGAAENEGAVRRGEKVDERSHRRLRRLRHGLRAGGRTDLPVYLSAGGLQKALSAAVDIVDDRRRHPRGV